MISRGGMARAAVVGLSTGALVALTACGAPAVDRAAPAAASSTAPSSASSTATTPVSPSATATATASATDATTSSSPTSATPSRASTPSLPKGYRWRTVEKVHTTFATPDSWTAIDPAKLGKLSADSPEIQKLAKRMGLTGEQVSTFLSHVDLYLAGPPVKGYSPNIQAIVLPLAELPSDAALTTQISTASIRPPQLKHLTTGVGEGVSAAFSMKVGTKVVVVRNVFLDTDEGILNLTFGAGDDKSADRMAATVLRSLHTS